MAESQDWLTQLKAHGYRLTGARRAVVQVVASSARALTPVEVYDAARTAYPALGLVTVYRTLEKLEELGLIQRVHQEQGCNAYLPHAQGHQHLLICQRCGRAVYFDGDDLTALFARVGDEHGFVVREHWLQLFGLCAKCQPEVNRDVS
ncbi:MAG: transcriptional repressor [Chloroflexi bacterium]|nr:transcriptional repressor [Chloroflexota bacterium]